jgi:hypothetical protein
MTPEITSKTGFDPLVRFAELERLVGKIYFRFSHLFLHRPALRDFWWQMAMEEEQHACILLAIRIVIENYLEEAMDPGISQDKADHLKVRLLAYLRKGTPAITAEEAFRIALEIESSEIDAIYSKLLQLGGPQMAKMMEQFGVPASVQILKLKSMLRQSSKDPELLAWAESL